MSIKCIILQYRSVSFSSQKYLIYLYVGGYKTETSIFYPT